MNNNRYQRRKAQFPFFLLFIPLVLLLSGIVMLLWNAILPSLLHVSNISYGQSIGLLILCRILFGGFHFGSSGRRIPYGPSKQMREKWMNMSADEKAKFKNEWQKRCRRPPQPPAPEQQ